MKRKVLQTGSARADLLEIWCHFAETDMAYADRLVGRIRQKMEALARSPRMGRLSFPVSDYIIFYEPVPEDIRVVRVLSGYRGLPLPGM